MQHERKGSIEETITKADPATRGLFYDFFEQVIQATRVSIWQYDLLEKTIIFSEEIERLTGYSTRELEAMGAKCRDLLVLPADLDRVFASLSACLAGTTGHYEVEYRILCKDGAVKWVQDRGAAVDWDHNKKPIRIIGMMHDISHYKQTEEALSEKVMILDTAANMTGLGTLNWDIRSNRMQYDKDFLQMFGYTHDEAAKSFEKLLDFISPEDQEMFSAGLMRFVAGEMPEQSHSVQVRGRRKDGELIWVHAMARIVERDEAGAPARIYACVLNVDRLVRAELEAQKQLRENQARNQQLQQTIDTATRDLEEERRIREAMLDANPYMCIIFDDAFTPIDCNPALLEFFGYSAENKGALLSALPTIVENAIPAVQPTGKQSLSYQQRLIDAASSGYNEFDTEMEFFGRQVTMNFVMKKIPYRNSFAIAVYQFDMTDIRKNERELIHQEKLLQTVNATASLLMESDQALFLDSLCECLHMLCASLGVHRAAVWKNEQVDGRAACCQLSEWVDGDVAVPQSDWERVVYYDELMPNRQVMLSTAEDSINAPLSELPEELSALACFQGVESVLLLPMESQGKLWGFLGFGDCVKRGRVFTAMEESIMRSAGMLIGAAVMRNEMTEHLIDAREEALENARAKSDFLSRMSHEIRTPMNAIIGMTTIAKKTNDQNRMQYCLDRINSASRQLLELINDVLDMSKIEANKMELSSSEFNFESMIHDVYNVVITRVEEKKLKFSFTFTDLFTRRVVCDELRLSQVLINLINNAVKFTPENGHIVVQIGYEPHSSGAVQLNVSVQDDGIGVAGEKQERLFHAFEQGDGGTTREYGGSGLGLAICRSIVHLMGGEIGVESEEGSGATFTFSALFQWGGVLTELQPPAAPHKELRILVVDDAEDVREYFHNLITGFSLHCVTVSGGAQAVELVQRDADFDLVFVDWIMPGMSGRETVWALRGILGHETPIILMSVADWSDVESKLPRESISGFLGKPVLPSTLYNTIMEVTDQRQVEQQDVTREQRYRWPGKRLLVVEDIEINREILLSILADSEVEIDCAQDGLEAVQFFLSRGDLYDLILMDVQMPKLNGLDATTRIRESGCFGCESIPIIAMTANAFREDVERCLQAGMDEHVAKPINTEDLFLKLDRYLCKR